MNPVRARYEQTQKRQVDFWLIASRDIRSHLSVINLAEL